MSAKTEEVVSRGVRWRRSASGRAVWYNEGLGRWVTWHEGADAPPVPEGWAAVVAPAGRTGEPAGARAGDAMSNRLPLRSPFRMVPIVIFLAIIGISLYQALKPPSQATRADISAAMALQGRCLARGGGSAAAPVYSSTPVACSDPTAAVRVVSVVKTTAKVASCPRGSEPAFVVKATVLGEPFECLAKLKPRR